MSSESLDTYLGTTKPPIYQNQYGHLDIEAVNRIN